jgi:hypothetical protein
MKLIIFSYKHHFNIMQLAYKHALTAIDDITEVVVVWDDKFSGDDKIAVTERILTVIPDCQIIFHSDIESCQDEPLGWLRQQYVKLSLHKIFNDNSWILLDADVILKNKKQFYKNNTLLVYTDSFDYYQPYFDFIKHTFNLDKQQSPSYMTHFALFERSVLTAIDEWCRIHHNKELIEIFKEFYRPLKKTVYAEPMTPPLSEFEIYGLFCERILQKSIHCVEDSIPNYRPMKFCKKYQQDADCYYQGIDSEIDDNFWQLHLK